MKMCLSLIPVEVKGNFITMALLSTPPESTETYEVKNIHEVKALINNYIIRNVKEGHKHLMIRKAGRAVAGFNALYHALPSAINAETRV